jgi:hypothetical protein
MVLGASSDEDSKDISLLMTVPGVERDSETHGGNPWVISRDVDERVHSGYQPGWGLQIMEG